MAAATDDRPAEYADRLRALVVAALDLMKCQHIFRRGGGGQLRPDIIRAAEHLHGIHAELLAPVPADPPTVWASVADDVVACVAAQRWSQLQPTRWGKQHNDKRWNATSWPRRCHALFRMYYEVTVGRAFQCLDGRGDYESYRMNRWLASVWRYA